MTDGGAPRVVIAGGETLSRADLARGLDRDGRVRVAGEAADGREALELVTRVRPDAVLLDVGLPGLDSAEATSRITREHPEVKVLVLTTFDADRALVQALESDASGYLLWGLDPAAVAASILAAIAGERVTAPAVAGRVLETALASVVPTPPHDALTPREIEILTLLATGMANEQIAYKLSISEKTVRNHLSNLYEKLEIDDRSQAVLYAVRNGLAEPE